MSRIFDCFTFFNELEVLEIRLEEMYSAVDCFVICEAPVTFRGKPKKLVFHENRKMFARYEANIRHLVVDDMPEGDNPWAREDFQRNALRRGFTDAAPQDVIMISDVDEIIRASTVEQLRGASGVFLLETQMYQYYINLLAEETWDRPYAFSHDKLRDIGDLNRARANPRLFLKGFPDSGRQMPRAGWHFTYLGGAGRVREKLNAYSHTGGHYDDMSGPGAAERLIEVGAVVGGGKLTTLKPIDASFPRFVLDNQARFEAAGLIKSAADRVRDLEAALSRTMSQKDAADRAARHTLAQAAALFGKGLKLAAPFRTFTEDAALEGGGNLLSGTKGFTHAWRGGTQAVGPRVMDGSPPVVLEHVVLRHERQRRPDGGDDNMGWWEISDVEENVPYTASCWIRVPAAFRGQRAALYGEGLGYVSGNSAADLLKRDVWQRLTLTALGLPGRRKVNLILRVQAPDGDVVDTTCWQFQVGERATQYLTT